MKLLSSLLVAALLVPLSAIANVKLTETAKVYTLDNGIVTAQISKESGDIVSLRYKGVETLATINGPDGQPDLEKDPPGANPNGINRGMTDHQYGFWSHDAMGPRGTAPAIARVTIDPAKNGGARAEVSVKGIADNGRKMGTGPGASQNGQFQADVEIRFALGRDDSGVYTYCQFEHKPGYGYTSLGEARFCAKLADYFDWMSVAETRNKHYPKELREGDKYIYTVNQTDNPAFGWSSTTKKIGFFLINPSMEYISGGPTKVEFLGHRDTNAVAAPCVLNYWRSSHYGGARVDAVPGEQWAKVIGPFMLYVTSGETPQAIYDAARAQQKKEAAKWPYEWVAGVDYPTAKDRSVVKGQLVLNDAQAKTTKLPNLRVGLTHPAYSIETEVQPPAAPRGGGAGRGGAGRGGAAGAAPTAPLSAPIAAQPPAAPAAPTYRTVNVDWQTDAKHYQFWVKAASDDGRFEIPKVRAGKYTLHAFADGVLGPYAKADVVVEKGKPLDLGKLTWTPVRKGKQLWEVGIPNRAMTEFAYSADYWRPEAPLNYPKYFPNHVNFVIGKSDVAKDWYFQHVPTNEDPNTPPGGFNGITAAGKATPYSITFNVASAPKGTATLRLGIVGTGAREIEVVVNDQPAGKFTNLGGDGIIARHGQHGIWNEREIAFNANLLKPGTNVLKIVIPAGQINFGMLYDYIRLELDETKSVAMADVR